MSQTQPQERAPPDPRREELMRELHRAACEAIPDVKCRTDAMNAVWFHLKVLEDSDAIHYLEQEIEAMKQLADEVAVDRRLRRIRLVTGTGTTVAAAIGYLSTKLM